MRVFHIHGEQFTELPDLPPALPEQGFIWIGSARDEFEAGIAHVQSALQRWSGGQLVDLHVSDLLSHQLPSHYDYTSWYDVMVFRRLIAGAGNGNGNGNGNGSAAASDQPGTAATARQALAAIDTSPVGFALFDHVLLTVHPTACAVREYFAQRMAGMVVNSERGEARGSARLPTGPADLMLRMLNYMVDSYLDLRRVLTKQLGALQAELLAPGGAFNDWQVLLESRNTLHLLEDTCEDQRAAVQEWIDALDEWPDEAEPDKRREREMLRVRSRDVLEHIERVLSHVRRLEHSAETAVQMHFSALSHRTNDIMRTLTVLTAVFLPLNLIVGFWGMNFDVLPLIHAKAGAWGAVAIMAAVAIGLLLVFRRKHYLSGKVLMTVSRRQLWVLAVLTVVWGLNWPVMKLGISGTPAAPSSYPPLAFRSLSMLFGVPVLGAALLLMRIPLRLPRDAWLPVLKLALPNMMIWHVVVIVALQSLSSGRSAILGYTMPVFSALWGYAVFGERLAWRQIAGVAAAGLGVVLLLWSEFSLMTGAPLAALALLAAACIWALGTHQLRRAALAVPLLTAVFWMTTSTTLLNIALSTLFERDLWRMPEAPVAWAIAYNAVGVFGFAHAAWFYLARSLPPVASSISVMLIPVLGTFSGAWALGEALHWQDFAAMALMVVAIAAVLLKR